MPAFIVLIVAALLFGAAAGPAAAHGGLSLDDDVCKLRLGPYFMHFAGYQPETTGAEEFCEDIPKTGQIIVTMDMIDQVLRTMPVSVRIVRDTGDESQLDSITELYVSPALYPNGSVSFEHEFKQPGKFVGLVTAGADNELVSRFPFSVGLSRPAYETYLLLLLVPVLGYSLYMYSRRAKRAL